MYLRSLRKRKSKKLTLISTRDFNLYKLISRTADTSNNTSAFNNAALRILVLLGGGKMYRNRYQQAISKLVWRYFLPPLSITNNTSALKKTQGEGETRAQDNNEPQGEGENLVEQKPQGKEEPKSEERILVEQESNAKRNP